MICNLKKDSQLFIGQNKEKNSTYIFFKDNIFPHCNNSKLIHSISSSNPFLIEEIIPDKSKKISRLVIIYKDEEKQEWCIEKIDFSQHDGELYSKDKQYIKTTPRVLASGTYFYQDKTGLNTLASAYNNETIQPEKIFNVNYNNGILRIKDVSFPFLVEDNPNKHLTAMCLHFGTEEIIHLILKIPTNNQESFQVSPYIWSEMTDKQYQLWQDKYKYMDFFSFLYYLKENDLAKEIVYVNNYVREENTKLKRKIRNNIQDYINEKK